MKKLFLLLATVFGMVYTGWAQASNHAQQAKTPAVNGANELEFTTCKVTKDASGNKNAVLTRSTGSKALDQYIKNYVGGFLNGSRYPDVSMSVTWKVVAVSTAHGNTEVRIAVPRPPYPYQARARSEQGSGLVKASFDESGQCISAEMAPSTGSKILDGNTLNFALAKWRSTGGNKITTTIPVSYQLVSGGKFKVIPPPASR